MCIDLHEFDVAYHQGHQHRPSPPSSHVHVTLPASALRVLRAPVLPSALLRGDAATPPRPPSAAGETTASGVTPVRAPDLAEEAAARPGTPHGRACCPPASVPRPATTACICSFNENRAKGLSQSARRPGCFAPPRTMRRARAARPPELLRSRAWAFHKTPIHPFFHQVNIVAKDRQRDDDRPASDAPYEGGGISAGVAVVGFILCFLAGGLVMWGYALAIVTDSGSRTSHAVIVARSLKIPAVVGMRDLTARVHSGDRVLVDGYEGVVILNPTEQTLLRYGRIRTEKKTFESRLQAASRLPSETLDGVHVVLMANLEKVEENGSARESPAEGVGLFRTEYLYLNSSHLPGEEEQFATYQAVAAAFAPRPVVIRTLDLGGDKPLEGIPGLTHHETNPFLGFRAIRLCLEHPELFKEQLRAILRASAFGRVRLMYPMISGVDELARAAAILDEAKEELRKRKVDFDERMEVGSMIEIPSAAVTVDLLARHCQFFSIGTNDLIQYLLAVDRGNDRIAHLYEPTHPAVLRTIRSVVVEAHRRKLPVAVCGEMAGDPVFASLLLGLGVDELSMAPPLLPAVKFLVRSMKMSDARQLAVAALAMSDPKEIYARAEAFYTARVIAA